MKDIYIREDSKHPKSSKKSMIVGFFNRALDIPNTLVGKSQEIEKVYKTLRKNGYRDEFLDRILKTTVNKWQKRNYHLEENLTEINNRESYTNCAILKYIGKNTDKFKKKLKKIGIITALKPQKTIKEILPKFKGGGNNVKKDAVYKIKCKKCVGNYIGQT